VSIQAKAQQNSIGMLLKSHNSLYLELSLLLIQIPAVAVTHNPGDGLFSRQSGSNSWSWLYWVGNYPSSIPLWYGLAIPQFL